MNPDEFQNFTFSELPLRELVLQTAKDSGLHAEPQKFATGLEPFAIWVCYALFRWSKLIFDARQRQLELDIIKQQSELINQLVSDGWKREQAHKVVTALLDGLSTRQNDPAFQKALQKAIEAVGRS